MEYLMFVIDEVDDGEKWDPVAADFEAWVAEADARGVRIRGNRLAPPAEVTVVRQRAGDVLLSDAPLSETKEWIAGYDVLEAATLDEAIDVASRHPRARTGRIELYPTIPLDFPNPQH